MQKMRILVMAAMPYDIKNDDGTVNSGITVEYYFFPTDDSLKPEFFNMEGLTGYRRAKAALQTVVSQNFCTIPAVYDGNFEMTIGSDGKPKLALRDVSLVADIRFVVAGSDGQKK